MKHEFRASHPADLKPAWAGQFELFSWLNHALSIPGVVFLITTRKESGAPNACLHAWGMLAGDTDRYTSVLAVPDYAHTHANILREGEWCLNFPRFDQYQQSFRTIGSHGPDEDEIAAAGFTPEGARTVRAPRVAECPVVLECRLTWHRPLQEGSCWHLFAGLVETAALAEEVLDPDPERRMKAMGLMYSFNEPRHPATFARGSGGLGLLERVVNVHNEDGSLKAPEEVLGRD